jgi:predicted amino acid-binding ACT domain protein
LLESIETEVNIVDPIFSMPIVIEIAKNKNKIYKLIEDFDNKHYRAYVNQDIDNQEYYKKLNIEFNNILSDLNKWETE